MSIRPIFIFSAPRSGSTMLQRVLAAHSQVATASEPWVLLPLLSPLYDSLPAPGARERDIHEALKDFISELPDGRDDYRASVRELAVRLYGGSAGRDWGYFVDKTPLYHLIVDEIFATFPDGQFIFLFRNPLSVVSSSVELFDGGRWEAGRYHMALFRSFVDLAPAAVRYADRSLRVRYEDLVTGEDAPWRRLIEFLELEWEPPILDQFSGVELRGRMGDPTGTRNYVGLSQEPTEKWRATISTPIRRAWCDRYLCWLGHERLAAMGYDLDELRRQLARDSTTGGPIAQDARLVAASMIRELLKPRLPRYRSRASTWRALLRG